MTKSYHYFQVVYHSYLGVKTINLLPLILIKVYTLINNVSSKTKWHNKIGEPLYTISEIPICLTFAKYNFYWESNLNGSCKLILMMLKKSPVSHTAPTCSIPDLPNTEKYLTESTSVVLAKDPPKVKSE